jgi:hypothetical protein
LQGVTQHCFGTYSLYHRPWLQVWRCCSRSVGPLNPALFARPPNDLHWPTCLSFSYLSETEKVCRGRLIISCAAIRYQLTYLQWNLQVGLSMMCAHLQAHQTLLEAGGWSKLFLKVITAHGGGPIQGAAALFQICLKKFVPLHHSFSCFQCCLVGNLLDVG